MNFLHFESLSGFFVIVFARVVRYSLDEVMNMLHQFTFKNYKSFREAATLDLRAEALKEHRNHVVQDVMDIKLLKIGAIYGANASGKSNVLTAFQSMRHLVLHSFRGNNRSRRFQPESNWFEKPGVPTEFEAVFSKNGRLYRYGFSILGGRIQKEYLSQKNSPTEEVTLLTREADSWTGALLEEIGEENILNLVDKQTLFLSVLAKLNIDAAKEAAAWFEDVKVADYDNVTSIQAYNAGLVALLENSNERKLLKNFLEAIDVGIVGIDIVSGQSADDVYNPQLDGNPRVVTYHENPRTGTLLVTPLSSESSGTLKLLMLYVDIRQAMAQGSAIFVDELDSKLHPLMIQYIITMFHSWQLNPNHAQLIFTTQEVFTLDKDRMRRDEIWFVDKNDAGESELYSLITYAANTGSSIGSHTNYARDYLTGKYKSVPRMRSIQELFE